MFLCLFICLLCCCSCRKAYIGRRSIMFDFQLLSGHLLHCVIHIYIYNLFKEDWQIARNSTQWTNSISKRHNGTKCPSYCAHIPIAALISRFQLKEVKTGWALCPLCPKWIFWNHMDPFLQLELQQKRPCLHKKEKKRIKSWYGTLSQHWEINNL